jgi:hypothetical protein
MSFVNLYFLFNFDYLVIDLEDRNMLKKKDIEKLIKILIGAENAAGINQSDLKMIVDKVT